jgi:glutamate-1-semialdehyde 2,1-aminomutase
MGCGVSSGLRASMRPHPIYFERGSGASIFDVDGNAYDDYVLGWGPLIAGHSHPRIVSEVSAQVALGQTFGSGHDLEYLAAERVCEAVPGVDRILWSNTGTEAAQIALRLARAATGRARFVKFVGHYHGWSDQMLRGYRPDSTGTVSLTGTGGQAPSGPDGPILLPWNDLDSVAAVLRDAASDVAAVFTEPVLCNTGVIGPVAGFLEGLRSLCDETGTLLVFDEVITGFRIAYGGAAARFGVEADLTVLAKALAGGFSLAAVGGRGDVIDLVGSGVVHAGTYNGNPVALRACMATLDVLSKPGTYARLERLGARLADGMRTALGSETSAWTGAVNQCGPVVQVRLEAAGSGSFELATTDDYFAANWARYDDVVVEMLRRGVFALPGGRWYLSTAHGEAEVDRAVEVFAESLRALAARS